jgi:carbohydrate esterase-like sialic acid-specific acetylesterase
MGFRRAWGRWVIGLVILLAAGANSAWAQKNFYKVFLLAGQSNMVGQGNSLDLPEEYRTPPKNAYIFEEGQWQRLRPLDDPGERFRDQGYSEMKFGPEIGFGHAIAKAWPDQRVGIIKFAVGGTGINAWLPSWDRNKVAMTNDLQKGVLYDYMMAKYQAAKVTSELEVVGFVWMQGGADMRSVELSDEYLLNLQKLIAAVRKDTKLPGMPFIIGSHRAEGLPDDPSGLDPDTTVIPGRERPGAVRVLQAQWKAQTTMPFTRTVPLRNIPTVAEGNVHWNALGCLQAGEQFAQAYLDLVQQKD